MVPFSDMMLLATIAPKGTQRRCIALEVDPGRPLPWIVLPMIVLLGDW